MNEYDFKSKNSDSSGEQDSDPDSPKMRIGKEYQAEIPKYIGPPGTSCDDLLPRVTKIWSPTDTLTDVKLELYLQLAREKHGYTAEQAMGMLYWHNYDTEVALNDLQNFTPFPDELSLEDKVVFEQAFQNHGKSFRRIHSMLPDKSVGSLVKYYYSWKKTRCRARHISRQARYFARSLQVDHESSEDESEGQSRGGSSDGNFDLGKGSSRKAKNGRTDTTSSGKSRTKLPKGIYLSTGALEEIAKQRKFNDIDNDIVQLRRFVQHNKQQLSQAEGRLQQQVSQVERLRPTELQ